VGFATVPGFYAYTVHNRAHYTQVDSIKYYQKLFMSSRSQSLTFYNGLTICRVSQSEKKIMEVEECRKMRVFYYYCLVRGWWEVSNTWWWQLL